MKRIIAALCAALFLSLATPATASTPAHDECSGAHGRHYPCLFEKDSLPPSHQLPVRGCFDWHTDTAGVLTERVHAWNRKTGEGIAEHVPVHNAHGTICINVAGSYAVKWSTNGTAGSGLDRPYAIEYIHVR